ncbi:MAG: hypothetical protein IH984_08310 [Planctomycetes bacterium]|nr:hypothetical protein [Planctomycetota bacterium]
MTTSKKAMTNKTTTKEVNSTAKSSSNSKVNGNQAKIAELLKKLKAATLRSEKQQIRRQLRVLGHRGGLNRKPAVKPKSM